MNQIEISYNPYRGHSRIVVGGRPIPDHSALSKYRTEPFHLWCDQIFPLITNELNDEFELRFTSGFLECEIMKKLGQGAVDCRLVETSACTVNLPMQQRFDALLGAQKATASYLIHLQTPTGKERLLAPLMSGFTQIGNGAYELETGYRFVKAAVKTGVGFSGKPGALTVLLSEDESDWAALATGISTDQPSLFIRLDNHIPTGFYAKNGSVYCYNCEPQKLPKLLLRFLEYACMVVDFRELLRKVRQTASGTPNLSLEALDSIDPVLQVTAPPVIEVGQGLPLEIEVFPPGCPCPPLTFDVVPADVVDCSMGRIEGLRAGRAEVVVYPKGGVEACSRFVVDVIQRNRITSLTFPAGNLLLPEGEIRQIPLEFSPENADNQNQLQWTSSDNGVALVKQDGRVKAVAPGKCNIRATVEGVTVTCTLTVKPVIRQITLTEQKLRIHIGESAALAYSFAPADAYEPEIRVKIDDPTIVEYQNGKLLPRCVGKTAINFESVHGAGRARCEVEVDSSFHKKQKGAAFVPIGVILCLLSFFTTGALGVGLGAAGFLCAFLGFLRGKTVTPLMLAVAAGSLFAIGRLLLQMNGI